MKKRRHACQNCHHDMPDSGRFGDKTPFWFCRRCGSSVTKDGRFHNSGVKPRVWQARV